MLQVISKKVRKHAHERTHTNKCTHTIAMQKYIQAKWHWKRYENKI